MQARASRSTGDKSSSAHGDASITRESARANDDDASRSLSQVGIQESVERAFSRSPRCSSARVSRSRDDRSDGFLKREILDNGVPFKITATISVCKSY